MRLIRTEDAAGHVLCHDMTQIIPGVTKDARFRKGHVVTEEDIPVLLSIGKEHLYVWEKTDGMLHEDEGAERLRKIAQNENMHPSEVKEGKIELIADIDGLFQVDVGIFRKHFFYYQCSNNQRHDSDLYMQNICSVHSSLLPAVLYSSDSSAHHFPG